MAKVFDNYEVHGCKDFFAHAKNDGARYKYTEQVEDGEATFWTLYGHITGEGVQAIGDFKTRRAAEEVMALIVGSRPSTEESELKEYDAYFTRAETANQRPLTFDQWREKAKGAL